MIPKWFDVLVFIIAIAVVVATRRDYRKGLLSERVVILWTLGAITGAVLAIIPQPFVALFRAVGVISYPSAPIVLAIMFLFITTYGLSRKLGRTSRMLRQLAVRDAVAQVIKRSDESM